MPAAELERALEAWSRAHAALVLLAAACAWWLGALWPLALAAGCSFPVLVLRHRQSATPSGGFGLANWVTSLRLLIVLALAARGATLTAALCGAIVLGVFTLDGVDGWLARSRGEASALGAHFDMESDALLVLVSACLLVGFERAGVWLLLAGALRYLYVLATWLIPPPAQAPSRSRFGRYVFSFYVTSSIACFFIPPWLGRPLSALATLLLLVSFARSSLAAYARS